MRTEKSIKNILTALFGQIFGILITFISRIVFIRTLGAEYLGLNGLFINILSILSLAELGIGSAMVYSLYKPLAEKNKIKIQGLMNFYATAYRLIGIVVLLLGLFLLPFLNYIVKTDIPNIELIYLLYVSNSVITYFYAYKRSIIMADQKNYIITFYRYSFIFVLNVVQIIILILTGNFILFLLIQIIFSFLENITISFRANKLYPSYLNSNKTKIDTESKSEVIKNVRAMFFHKIGGIVVDGTDDVLIASFSGLFWVGLYSNYSLIINALNSISNQIFISITASVGNLNVLEGKGKSKKVYDMIHFSNFWIIGFSSICLWILINPFISLWLGKKFLLSETIVLLIIINFYLKGMRRATLTFKDAYGLFWNDRYKPLLEAILNILFSVILGMKFGIVGILIGNILSNITTNFWIEPYILFKYGFNSRLKLYYITYGKYTFILMVSFLITNYISSFIPVGGFNNFILLILVCIGIPNILFYLFFRKRPEFKQCMIIVNSVLKKMINKKIS